jgi:hypothetical protein
MLARSEGGERRCALKVAALGPLYRQRNIAQTLIGNGTGAALPTMNFARDLREDLEPVDEGGANKRRAELEPLDKRSPSTARHLLSYSYS